MAKGLSTPRGTADVLPDESERRDRLVDGARSLLEGAGYRRIETPIFESTELFSRGVGGSTDIVRKEMYSFTDAGDRSITLRPEGTASVARSYVQHGMHKLPQPVKLWYHGPFFRYERAQAGRQRQFAQIGAEVLGSDDPAVDAELIVLLHRLIDLAGGQEITLRLGSLGSLEARAEYRERLVAFLRSREDELSEDVRGRIDDNPLRAFDAKDPGTERVMRDAPLLLDSLSGDDAGHFAQVRALLDAARVPYEIDKTLVRGLDYYTRTVFEFASGALGAQSGVGGGGRYDGLVSQIGGPPTPGCGWAAGVERLLLAGGDGAGGASGEVPGGVWILAEGEDRATAFRLADGLRRHGKVQIDLAGRSVNAQRKAAAKASASATVLVDGPGVRIVRRGQDDVEMDAAPGALDDLAGELLANLTPHRAGESGPTRAASPAAASPAAAPRSLAAHPSSGESSPADPSPDHEPEPTR